MKKRIKKLFEWFHSLDTRISGDGFVGTSWLGFVTILLAVVAGAVLTIAEGGIDDGFIIYALILATVVIVESVLSTQSIKSAIVRSLVMALVVIVAFMAGIISIFVVLAALLFINLLGGRSAGRRKMTIDGEEVSESSDLMGFDKHYESKTSDRKWRSSDGGNTTTEEL